MRVSKKLLSLVIVGFVSLFLVACGGPPRPLNEAQITEILPSELTLLNRGGVSHHFNVTDFTVERRQTEGNEDLVYAIIEMDSNNVRSTAFYALTIHYYDVGGWMIDDWRSFQPRTSQPLTPPPHDVVHSNWQIQRHDNPILISENIDSFELGFTTHTFQVTEPRGLFSHVREITLQSSFEDMSWHSNVTNDRLVSTELNSEAVSGMWTARTSTNNHSGVPFAPESTDEWLFDIRIADDGGGYFMIEGHVTNRFWSPHRQGTVGANRLLETGGVAFQDTVFSMSTEIPSTIGTFNGNQAFHFDLTYGSLVEETRNWTVVFEADRAYLLMDIVIPATWFEAARISIRTLELERVNAVATFSLNSQPVVHSNETNVGSVDNSLLGRWELLRTYEWEPVEFRTFNADGTGLIDRDIESPRRFLWTSENNSIFYTYLREQKFSYDLVAGILMTEFGESGFTKTGGGDNSLIGLWQDYFDMEQYEFFADGTGITTSSWLGIPIHIEWHFSDGFLIVTSFQSTTSSLYTISGDQLEEVATTLHETIQRSFTRVSN